MKFHGGEKNQSESRKKPEGKKEKSFCRLKKKVYPGNSHVLCCHIKLAFLLFFVAVFCFCFVLFFKFVFCVQITHGVSMEVSDCVHESMGDYSPTTFDEGFQHFVESPHQSFT